MSTPRHLQAILALPVMVIVAIPVLLIVSAKTINPLWGQVFPVNVLLAALGCGLAVGGFLLIGSTIRLFMTIGQGTLAPWHPPQALVVSGPYRHVRNPMLSGVISVLLGEGALVGSAALGSWALAVMLVNLLYIPLIEEPDLCQRFGATYQEYLRDVPRWIPRVHLRKRTR
jgi:protein-S-isoprenylcysteine O-methyltransferase Ste14